MQAFSARLTGISRVDRNRFNPVLESLVGNEPAQLIERPTIAASPFRLAAGLLIRAFPNTCQVFQRNDGMALECREDDELADVVV